MKSSKATQTLSLLFLYLLGFAAVTIVELLSINQSVAGTDIELSFSLSNLKTAIPSLLISYAALGCYTAATLIGQISKFKQNNADYLEVESNISNFSKKEYLPVIFNRYCTYTNRKRKINAWKKAVGYKWQRLENRQKGSDYDEWCKYLSDKNLDPNATTTNKYCLEREKLERMMSDEYIEQNIDRMRVKYNPITSSLVLGGVRVGRGNSVDTDEYITLNKFGMVVMEQAPRYFFMIALISTASSITVDAFQINTNWSVLLLFFFKMAIKIYSMINTIFSTIKYSETYNERVTMKDIRFRWGVCCEYIQWMKQEIKKQQEEKQNGNKDTNSSNSNNGAIVRNPDDIRESNCAGIEPAKDNSSNQQLGGSVVQTCGQLNADLSTD